jgi:SAM-dependent methyltransferase
MSLPTVIRIPAVTTRLGPALLALMPKRAAAFKAGQLPAELTLVDQILIVGLVREHQRHGRLHELTALHDWFWANAPAVQFHEFAETRFEGWFLGHHVAIVPALREALAADTTRFDALCEIGCGCGRALQYLSQAFADVPRMIGIDLSGAQAARNRTRYAGERMEFEAGDAVQWIAEHARPRWIYFSYGGVLEFFARQRVLELYEMLASRLAPAMVALVEPLSDDHDLAREPGSKVFGAENTFSHNHPELLRQAGFRVLSQFEQRVDNQRWLLLVARGPDAAVTS